MESLSAGTGSCRSILEDDPLSEQHSSLAPRARPAIVQRLLLQLKANHTLHIFKVRLELIAITDHDSLLATIKAVLNQAAANMFSAVGECYTCHSSLGVVREVINVHSRVLKL